MSITKFLIMSSVAASALMPMAAAAQTATEPAAGSEEIVVTARRQDEKLKDVPASVTVITAGAIANTGARVAADYVQLTPGVTIVTGVVEAGDTQIAIRGINGARDGENNVALVVDGVLKSNTALLAQDQGALSQIEILKGPQGAYYGRSAVAGAIVIATKKPGADLEISGRVSAANNNTFAAAAVISGPIALNLGFVLNGEYATTYGFYRDVFQTNPLYATTYPGQGRGIGASVDDNKRWNINGRLLFTPSSDTEIDFKTRYSKLKGAAIGFNAIFQLPGLAGLLGAPVFNIDANDHQFVFARNVNPENNQQSFEASLRLTQKLTDDIKLAGYVAYSNTKNDFFADGTSGTFGFFNAEPTCAATTAALTGFPVQAPFAVGIPGAFLNPYSPGTCDGTQYQQRDQKDISAELRLSGSAGDTLNWSIGGYYLNIDRFNCNNLGVDTGQGVIRQCYTTDGRNPTEALAQDSFNTNVYAIFGSLEYKPTDRLTISAAARYDIEQRTTENGIPTGRRTRWVGNVLTGVPNGTARTRANYFLNPGLDPAYNPSGVLLPRKATFKQIQPKISISYAATDDISVFANWGIGFKTGGFNNAGSEAIVNGFFNQGINAGLSVFDDYRKETSSAFEVGVKGSVAPGVTFELAGYYTDVKDSQFFEFFVGPFGLLRVVSNIDKVEFKGVEGSFNARVMDGFTVFGSANYTDSKIKRNSARPYTVGNEAPATSKYTVNLGAQYDGPITDTLGLLLRADYRITGPTYFHTVQNNDVPTQFGLGANYTNSRRDAYGILNLRGGIKADHWSLVAFANNVTKKRYLAEVIVAPEFGGAFVAPGALRTFGIEGTFKF
ncbi:TonB-dependent receptor [Novosphingobium sp. Chol11]|uniref:TonB-dependent receptor n=1 Tax=Novosphingobium sp. Chol11 TaxID=1385763 RepID=UPI0025DD90B1|nr:TonB-dependent receptor [Novosphingobium sp. Chol11]